MITQPHISKPDIHRSSITNGRHAWRNHPCPVNQRTSTAALPALDPNPNHDPQPSVTPLYSSRYESQGVELLAHAFAAFPTKAYVLLTLPHTAREPPLLELMSRVPTKQGSNSPELLYLFTRCVLQCGALGPPGWWELEHCSRVSRDTTVHLHHLPNRGCATEAVKGFMLLSLSQLVCLTFFSGGGGVLRRLGTSMGRPPLTLAVEPVNWPCDAI